MCFNEPQFMFQLASHTGLVETLGLPPNSRYMLKTDYQYLY